MARIACVVPSAYCLTVACADCGVRVQAKRNAGPGFVVLADLDGPAFRAYYCQDCGMDRLKREVE